MIAKIYVMYLFKSPFVSTLSLDRPNIKAQHNYAKGGDKGKTRHNYDKGGDKEKIITVLL